jgi:hypothetical protein
MFQGKEIDFFFKIPLPLIYRFPFIEPSSFTIIHSEVWGAKSLQGAKEEEQGGLKAL